MGEQCGDRGGGLLGEATGLEVSRDEGEGAVVEHALGELVGVDGGLDPEVPEHSVRFPAAEEHDGVTIDVGTEEGGGTAWSEGPGGEFLVGDPGGGFEGFGGVAEAVGDVVGCGVVPLVVVRVCVEV